MKIHWSRSWSENEGFTLLEIMISLAIISMTLLTVLHTANFHAGTSFDNVTTTQMMQTAKEKIYELEKGPANSKGAADTSGILWENTVTETGLPGIVELRTTVRANGRELTLTELIVRKEHP